MVIMPFTQDDQVKYKALYLQTARQYVTNLQANLTKLSGGETKDIIDTLHRDSHSLKGQSLMMGYQAVGSLALLMENIFRAKTEKTLDLTTEIITELSAGVKEIGLCLDEIDKNNKELDLNSNIEKLKSLTKVS